MEKDERKEVKLKLAEYAQYAHMAAAWGFAAEGFWMEKAIKAIEELEAILEARDAYDRGESFNPPCTGKPKTTIEDSSG